MLLLISINNTVNLPEHTDNIFTSNVDNRSFYNNIKTKNTQRTLLISNLPACTFIRRRQHKRALRPSWKTFNGIKDNYKNVT